MDLLKDTPEALQAFFGKNDFKSDGLPTDAWLREHLKLFSTAYPLILAWRLSEQVKKIRCRKLVWESLCLFWNRFSITVGSYPDVKVA